MAVREKKGQYGLRADQLERVTVEAGLRGVSIANMLRHIVDWYFSALDSKREKLVAESEGTTPK